MFSNSVSSFLKTKLTIKISLCVKINFFYIEKLLYFISYMKPYGAQGSVVMRFSAHSWQRTPKARALTITVYNTFEF